MRIIAGKFRGQPLTSPSDDSVRPTSDRIRESMFSILSSKLSPNFDGIIVLDLFAGTGALGFEALSRGASFATFVDTGAEARGLVRGHIEDFGVGGVTKLLKRDATDMGKKGTHVPANLVFCDPPYAKKYGERALKNAFEGGWFAPDALIVLEEKRGQEINLDPQFELQETRSYADTDIHFISIVEPASTSAE